MSSKYAMKTFMLISILFVLFLLLRFLERKSIYFPLREIGATPHALGLAYDDIHITTEDGIGLTGWFVPSVNARATILFCHGNGGNISHRLEKIRILNLLNLHVLILDYRGYGKSGGSPSEEGLSIDAEAAYQYLVRERGIPPRSILAYGESLGGAVVIDMGVTNEMAGMIIEGAFTSVRDMARQVLPFIPAFLLKSRYDSLKKIKDIGVPKLIIHSRDDEIVPFDQGERLYLAAQGRKEFLELQGGHNDAFLISREVFTSGIDSFVQSVGAPEEK